MNLRQRVLEQWKDFKDKLIKERELVKFLATQSFEETVLPMFPIGIESCRQKLDGWTGSDYRIKLSQHKSSFIEKQTQLENFGVTNESLILLGMAYTNTIDMFIDLTQGWKKEKDSYARYKQNNDSNSGPIIEEVDDW